MCACSAFDNDFHVVESSLRSAVLVSESRHARVYRCGFSASGSSNEQFCCVKTLQADDSFLRHQLSLFTRLSEVAPDCGSDREADERGVLPLLRFGVIPAFAQSQYRATLYVVTPWVEGCTLQRLIAKAVQGKAYAAISEALALLRAIAASLRDFGRYGGACLIHQDFRPSNILISSDSRLHAIVVDLDTAFFLDEMPQKVPRGSYGYTAPESMFRADPWPNETMDVFSFGVIAHEVLTGCWPYSFPPRPDADLLFWTSCFRRKGALRISEDLPSDIRQLLESCVSLDPHERPSHENLVERLDELVSRYTEPQELRCLFESGASSFKMHENAVLSDTF